MNNILNLIPGVESQNSSNSAETQATMYVRAAVVINQAVPHILSVLSSVHGATEMPATPAPVEAAPAPPRPQVQELQAQTYVEQYPQQTAINSVPEQSTQTLYVPQPDTIEQPSVDPSNNPLFAELRAAVESAREMGS
jgi:hypothetical protein